MTRRDLGDLRAWAIRKLGVTECGEYGGQAHSPDTPIFGSPRWCRKPFGHRDSCTYEAGGENPNTELRAWFKGWLR